MSEQLRLQEKSIVFIGFMGVGKTTIGKMVAKKLYRDFIDIDEAIEKEFKIPTTQIFKEFGEKTFRQKESDYVHHYCYQPIKVISLGGGAFMQEDIREVCLAHSIVFYLDISWDEWKKRLPGLIDSRPVLQNKSMSEIETLFNERKLTYNQHHSRVLTDRFLPNETADFIIESLKLSWELYRS